MTVEVSEFHIFNVVLITSFIISSIIISVVALCPGQKPNKNIIVSKASNFPSTEIKQEEKEIIPEIKVPNLEVVAVDTADTFEFAVDDLLVVEEKEIKPKKQKSSNVDRTKSRGPRKQRSSFGVANNVKMVGKSNSSGSTPIKVTYTMRSYASLDPSSDPANESTFSFTAEESNHPPRPVVRIKKRLEGDELMELQMKAKRKPEGNAYDGNVSKYDGLEEAFHNSFKSRASTENNQSKTLGRLILRNTPSKEGKKLKKKSDTDEKLPPVTNEDDDHEGSITEDL